ncbi:hypothetical protein [Streptomyces sp. Je 1-332]|uniref:hypothetical protein n=1 Tax=Streptomyces sp. Je 1-332 TaxID=3231270 RepID=UPI0034582F31
MAHTLDELAERQQAADAAHREVLGLRGEYGPPATAQWSDSQKKTYETAWRAWRDLARDAQNAIAEHAAEQGVARQEVEAAVETKLRAAGNDPA